MKLYTLTIAAVAVAASQVSSQSTESYATESTVTLSSQDPNFCVSQHSLVGCGMYSWCEWSPRARRCHAKADSPPVPLVSPSALVSFGNAYANKAHIELQPAKPLPGFCEKQTQQSGCSYFSGCTWEGTACYPIYTDEESTAATEAPATEATLTASKYQVEMQPAKPLPGYCEKQTQQSGCSYFFGCTWESDACFPIYTEEETVVASTPTETAPTVAAKSIFVAESEPLTASPIVYGTESLPVCNQQKSQFGCKLLPYCVWVADLCHTIIV